MAKLTKSQLAWRPGQRKKRRSTRVMFASVILTLEALIALFGGLVLFGLHGRLDGGVPYLLGAVALAVVLVLACAVLGKGWGIKLGWALQVVLVLLGILEPTMYVIGVLFLITWAYAMVQGSKIDRENARRDEEQLAWEAAHPED